MAQSQLRTAPNMTLKVSYGRSEAAEKTIGYAQNLSFSQTLGQKSIYTVDSPFIQEIAQGAAPSAIRGTVTLFMPKGSDPVRAGLVTPATNIEKKDGVPLQVASQFLNWRFYDRFTQELAFALNFVKVSSWSVSVSAKRTVQVSLNFEGIFYEQGTQ